MEPKWSWNPLPVNPTWELFPTCVLLCISAANSIQEAVCRKTTVNNNTVIIQVHPPISPPLLGSHSISLVSSPGSQTSPLFVESEPFNKMLIPVAKFHMRERCWEKHILTFHFYRPNITLTFKLTKLKLQHIWTHWKYGYCDKQMCVFLWFLRIC